MNEGNALKWIGDAEQVDFGLSSFWLEPNLFEACSTYFWFNCMRCNWYFGVLVSNNEGRGWGRLCSQQFRGKNSSSNTTTIVESGVTWGMDSVHAAKSARENESSFTLRQPRGVFCGNERREEAQQNTTAALSLFENRGAAVRECCCSGGDDRCVRINVLSFALIRN